MSKKRDKQIVLYDLHPQVALLREFCGYKDVCGDDLQNSVDDDALLVCMDPVNWRTNDHYAALGLGQSRFRATDDDIRKAYRRRVLTHHPDKRRHRGEDIKDLSHDYFSCITTAYEILGNTSKRFAYDCVDPVVVDDTIPSTAAVKESFFGSLSEVFRKNSRWSKQQPMPDLGHSNTPIEAVYKFYESWEAYESIRDYSYLDEEDKEKGEDRDHRRYLDKLNKAERAKKRAAEFKRIRQLVQLARTHDPRLKAEQERIKQQKEAKKVAKLEEAKRRREEVAERGRLEQKALERVRSQEEKEKRDALEKQKRDREAEKAIAKAERKRLRNLIQKRYEFFAPTGEKLDILHKIEILCHALSGTDLNELNDKLENAPSLDDAFTCFNENVKSHSTAAPIEQSAQPENAVPQSNGANTVDKWSFEATQCLIKAIRLFPPGTPKRWDVIAAYVSQHVPGTDFSSRETLKFAKSLTTDDRSLKEDNNSRAFAHFEQEIKQKNVDAVQATITTSVESESVRPWTVNEQRALESALKTVTPGKLQPGEDRWQRIADAVGTRTKKECMLRYKTLAEQVKAKKAALNAAAVK